LKNVKILLGSEFGDQSLENHRVCWVSLFVWASRVWADWFRHNLFRLEPLWHDGYLAIKKRQRDCARSNWQLNGDAKAAHK